MPRNSKAHRREYETYYNQQMVERIRDYNTRRTTKMPRPTRNLAVPKFRCRKCGRSIDFNTFDALQGYCHSCYQRETYGEKPLNYIKEESCRGETF